MRTLALVSVLCLVAACAKPDTPAADTAVVAVFGEADVAGTWTGVSMLEGSDSVVARWTQVCGGGSCRGVVEGSPDTVASTYTIDGDSTVGTSMAYIDPASKVSVVDVWVARPKADRVTGTQVTKLAGTDSVVARTLFEGTRGAQ